MIFKTLWSIESTKQPGKGKVEVGGTNRAGCDRSELDGSKIDSNKVDSRDNKVGKRVQKLFRVKNLSKSKKMVRSDFFTPRAKLVY